VLGIVSIPILRPPTSGRGTRVRCKPLEWWRNEKFELAPAPEGEIDMPVAIRVLSMEEVSPEEQAAYAAFEDCRQAAALAVIPPEAVPEAVQSASLRTAAPVGPVRRSEPPSGSDYGEDVGSSDDGSAYAVLAPDGCNGTFAEEMAEAARPLPIPPFAVDSLSGDPPTSQLLPRAPEEVDVRVCQSSKFSFFPAPERTADMGKEAQTCSFTSAGVKSSADCRPSDNKPSGDNPTPSTLSAVPGRVPTAAPAQPLIDLSTAAIPLASYKAALAACRHPKRRRSRLAATLTLFRWRPKRQKKKAPAETSSAADLYP